MYDKRLHKVNYKTEFKSDEYDKVYYAYLDDVVGYIKKAYLGITLTNGEVLKFYNITKMPEDSQQAIKSVIYDYNTVSSVTIPNTVTTIENNGLTFAWHVKKLTIPASVEQFGSEKSGLGPFLISDEGGDGPQIETVEFLGENTKIGSCAFYSCFDLSGVTLPSNLTEIPGNCFCNCFKLTSIELPSTLQTIGQMSFYGTGLRSITIPDTVTEIIYDAFENCTNLREIYYKGPAVPPDPSKPWGAENATLITDF